MIAPSTIVGGRYRVVRALGGGGMKLVYLAEDLRLAGRLCALAEMVDSFTSPDMQQQAVAAFQREADMLAQLANEHIPRIFDRFSEANHHYLVMEYIDGMTLEDELRADGGKVAPARMIDIALQILTTLEYLHNLDPPVIYRDLKPSNVMVTSDGMAKLIDFGIARHFAPLTNATMIGTQGYAPPEQYRGRVETRSDLYALGATMHHALSGRDPAAEPPFSFPPMRKLCPELDPELAAVVDHALAYDVVNRVRDAAEFKRRLIEIKTGASAPSKPAATASGRGAARPQLPLPLGNPGPAAGAANAQAAAAGTAGSTLAEVSGASSSPDAVRPPTAPRPAVASASSPTILSVASEMRCRSCARMIPTDSRFCSYCAADLRNSMETFRANADAETAVLNGGYRTRRTAGDSHQRMRGHSGAGRSRRRIRHPVLLIVAIFILSLLIKMILINAATPNPAGGSVNGAAEPPGIFVPGGNAVAPRLAVLRRALDAAGYRNVQISVEDGTLKLSGSVPDEFDRLNVEMLVFQTIGAVLLTDNLRVRDEYAGP